MIMVISFYDINNLLLDNGHTLLDGNLKAFEVKMLLNAFFDINS